MLKFKNVKIYGLQESIARSKYPMYRGDIPDLDADPLPKGISRAKLLAAAPNGSGHDTFLKGIIVQFDLKYPEYLTPQLQRYHWFDIISSQSKMHKLMSKELTQDDFVKPIPNEYLFHLNYLIKYGTIQDVVNALPMGYLKWMAITTNYLQLKTIYFQRKTHKLKEWRQLCEWIENLEMSKLITRNYEPKKKIPEQSE